MTAHRPAERVRACFRLASHPATGAAERAAALNRGLALIERYHLDPDQFDIPGHKLRPKAEPCACRHVWHGYCPICETAAHG